MRTHPIIHVSGAMAVVAIASSAVLAYAYPNITSVAAAPVDAGLSFSIPEKSSTSGALPTASSTKATTFGLPMSNAFGRVTKKTFGMAIHPSTSPVPNDRFNGFHVGVDFEVTEDEEHVDSPVAAVCDGPFISKQFAKGYGGYALQACKLDGDDVIVLYGHMDLESIDWKANQSMKRGETVGVLGEGHSHETDGVRKHLHLGVHRGKEIDIRGYVQATSEVNGWLDALPYMRQ